MAKSVEGTTVRFDGYEFRGPGGPREVVQVVQVKSTIQEINNEIRSCHANGRFLAEFPLVGGGAVGIQPSKIRDAEQRVEKTTD